MIDERLLIEELSKNRIFEKITVGEETVYDIINRLPKVGEWIPCSERLPEGCSDAEIELLVTINEEYIEASFDETVPALYYPETKTFHSVYRHRVDITNIVTAWRPLPEPYRKDV